MLPKHFDVIDRQRALVVDNVVKEFNKGNDKETPSLWDRLRGKKHTAKTEAETAMNGGTGTGTGKRKVIAVDHVSFEIGRGEIFGVLGPNGSGKSTLIRVISTLLTADSGSVRVFGYDIRSDEMRVKQIINRVSVDAAFFKKLSPLENLLYGARLYGVSGREAHDRAVEILKRLGLDPATFTQPMEEMSRGMQQKVAIARAFLSSPILLLLDEPTTGLDPRSKREVRAFVEELRDTHDATILITTHDMEEAEALCDRVAIIHDGKVVAMDTPARLKARLPRNGHEPTLEDVFMDLTGEQLINRDEVEPEMELELEPG